MFPPAAYNVLRSCAFPELADTAKDQSIASLILEKMFFFAGFTADTVRSVSSSWDPCFVFQLRRWILLVYVPVVKVAQDPWDIQLLRTRHTVVAAGAGVFDQAVVFVGHSVDEILFFLCQITNMFIG